MRIYVRHKRSLKCLTVCILSFFFIYIVIQMYFLSDVENAPYVTYSQQRNFNNNFTKKILIWTPFLSDNILKHFEDGSSGCKQTCMFTVNKSEISTVNSVLFHNYDLFPRSVNWKIGTKTTIPLPKYRRHNQVWVIYNLEPPSNMYWDPEILNGVFNWTAWYRKDATLWYPYGSKYSLNPSERNEARTMVKNRNFHKEKTREVTGMISNCKDQAQRYKLVYKMQKYLTVDMYGGCYDMLCERDTKAENKTCDEILKQYKFYLAFENSLCKDYVTEKYWNAIKREQIPIVNWKSINEDVVIPNSYINVYDFRDIKALAEYVKKVSSNETLYNSYFQWKVKYKEEESSNSCGLCQLLNRMSYQRQVYSGFDSWVNDDSCPKVTVSHSFPDFYIYRKIIL